jgi:hypothetical protein
MRAPSSRDLLSVPSLLVTQAMHYLLEAANGSQLALKYLCRYSRHNRHDLGLFL